MNRMNIFQLLRGGRFSALAALVGLGLLFTASSAKAGCAPLPYKAGAAPLIPFVSPHGDDQARGRRFERTCFHRGFVASGVYRKDG